MLRILLILGPLVFVAMLAHPINSIMVSAQPISARVEMLQVRVEPREISDFPSLINTLGRRRHTAPLPPGEAEDLARARQLLADNAASEAHLVELVSQNMAVLRRPGLTLSFELWSHHSNNVIEALQQLARRGSAAARSQLLALRMTFLEQYLEFLNDKNRLGQHLTEQEIQGAVARAQALHDMDRVQSVHWMQVLQLIGGLMAGSEDGQHNFRVLMRAVSLINQGIATAAFRVVGPQETLSFQQWNRHSNRAIGVLEELVRRGGEAASDSLRVLEVRKTVLEQYLEILIRLNGSDHHVTEGQIQGATDMAQALLDLDEGRSRLWRRVLRLIRVGNLDGQLQLVLRVVKGQS